MEKNYWPKTANFTEAIVGEICKNLQKFVQLISPQFTYRQISKLGLRNNSLAKNKLLQLALGQMVLIKSNCNIRYFYFNNKRETTHANKENYDSTS